MKLLLLDDDKEYLQTLLMRLNEVFPKAEIYTTTQEAEAISHTIKHQPDVAVVDLILEKMSGYDMITEIKKLSPKTKCIAFTGHIDAISYSDATPADATILKCGSFKRLERIIDVLSKNGNLKGVI